MSGPTPSRAPPDGSWSSTSGPGCRPCTPTRDAVTTVIDHLLDNAVKYSPDGGSLARVGSPRPAGETGWWSRSRTDGIGMTPEQVERCFERFWQAESTDVRRFGGTGIGLYIVRSLVEGMGGTTAVASEPGAWTVFSFTLRTAAPADTADDGPAEPPERRRERRASPR